MANDTPRVSVLLVNYNYADYLQEALDSVNGQTYREYEVVVADDGSTDHSLDVVSAYEPAVSTVVTGENAGLAMNVARGLSRCRGELVAFLSADDRWLADHLSSGVQALDGYPAAALSYSHVKNISQNGRPLEPAETAKPPISRSGWVRPEDLLPIQFIATQATLVRRAVLEEVGGIDPDVPALMAELDLFARIVARYPVVCTDRMTVEKRIHRASLSMDVPAMLAARLALYNKYLGPDTSREKRRMVSDAYWRAAYRELIADPSATSVRRARVHIRRAVEVYPRSVLRRYRLAMLVVTPFGPLLADRQFISRIKSSRLKVRVKRLLGIRK